MGQFDFDSAAALAQLENEDLVSSAAGGVVSKVAAIGGIVAGIAGAAGVAGYLGLYAALRDLAPAKDESNLIYFARSVVADIERLYKLGADTRRIVDQNLAKKEAGEVLANATLYVPRTNVEIRLQRLAHIFANGVRSGELEPESNDDMMRAAVELKEADVALLRKIYESQSSLLTRQLRRTGSSPVNWHGDIQQVWGTFVKRGELNPQEHLKYRSSLSRLASLGLIQQIDITNTYGVGLDIYALLVEGKVFCERIQEIGL